MRMIRMCALGCAIVALSACSDSASHRTTVPMTTGGPTTAVGFSPAPKTSSSLPESEEPEHHMQEVPSEKFIIDGFHVFDFNTGGDAVGHCKLMSDTFTCSGIAEGRDGDTNEVTVAPEGIEFTIGDGPYTAQDPVDLQPGEFIEVESVRCSMMDASKLICSGPGGTISINGPEQIVHEETNN